MEPLIKEAVAVLGGTRALGRNVRTTRDVDRLVRDGMPVSALSRTARRIDESESAIATALGIPRSTLSRRKTSRARRLDLAESERAFRLARIVALGEIALGSARAVGRWLKKPNRALGGAVPLQLLRTEFGARDVEAVLGRAVLGGYS